VKRADVRGRHSAHIREAQVIRVPVYQVEFGRHLDYFFQLEDNVCQLILAFLIQAQRVRRDRYKVCSCYRISARKQRNVMSLLDQFFGQPGHDRSVPPYSLGGTLSNSGATCAIFTVHLRTAFPAGFSSRIGAATKN